jgi:Glycosyltransferase family 87
LTLPPVGRALVWACPASVLHFLVFLFVTSGPPAAFCTHCTGGRLVNATDVSYYFEDTSPERSKEAALVEYPPLAKVVLMGPRLLATQGHAYVRTFMLEMLLCNVLTVLVIALWSATTIGEAAVPRRLAWYTAYVAVLSPLVFTRFDLVPALLAFSAAIAWGSGLPTLGAVGSALGALTKLFPGSVAAVGFVHEFMHRERTRLRGTVVFAVSVPVLTALSWTFGGHALFASYLDRRLQLESALAGILMVVGQAAGLPMTAETSHGAIELGMRGTRLLAGLTLPLQGSFLSAALYSYWRTRGSDFLRYTTAAILALIVPAKVLSPQYLIWLVPFVSVLEGEVGRRARWLLLVCCVATIVIFPFRYYDLTQFRWWAIGLLNLRNALLLVLFGALILGRDTAHRTRAVAS